MTMLTSLKALLFPSALSAGSASGVQPVEGAPDFAALMDGVNAAPAAQGPQAPSPALFAAADGATPSPEPEPDAALALASRPEAISALPLTGGAASIAPPLPIAGPDAELDAELDIGVNAAEGAPTGAIAASGSAPDEGRPDPEVATALPSDSSAKVVAPREPAMVDASGRMAQAPGVPAKAVTAEHMVSAGADMPVDHDDAETDALPVDVEAASDTKDEDVLPVPVASPDMPALVVSMVPPAPGPVTTTIPITPETPPAPAGVSAAAFPGAVGEPAIRVVGPALQGDGGKAMVSAGPSALSPPAQEAVAPDRPLPAAPDAPVVPEAPAAPEAPIAATRPVRGEAVSLLQLVRDHMKGRDHASTPAASAEPMAIPASDPARDVAAQQPALPANDRPLLSSGGAQPTIATPQPVLGQPTVDLSASLGAQVVDMGVSGQWIDGLARDIAGLSANGAQGRFQINAHQLGPIQVDIRQGEDGVAVSLMAATEAAEQALRQDSDRLKLDAGLSAVRISEVKVERAPPVAEAARSDQAGNQPGSQPQSQSHHGQSAGQSQSQSQAQSQMHGRGQQRENIAPGHKGASDPVVLNHDRAGDDAGDLPRARYA